MEQTKQNRGQPAVASVGHVVAAVVAVGGLSASVFAASAARARRQRATSAKGVVISTLKTKSTARSLSAAIRSTT